MQQPLLAKQRTLKETPHRLMEGNVLPYVSELDCGIETQCLDQQYQYLKTNEEQEDRCISSQRLSDRQYTLQINKVVSSQDQSEANHLLVMAPNLSSQRVLLACASSGDMKHGVPASQTDELQANNRMNTIPVIINMQTYKLPPYSALAELSPQIDKMVDQRELDCLMSVADNFSEIDESRLTNQTSQNPSVLLHKRMEPTMSAAAQYYRGREINNGSNLQNNSNLGKKSSGTPQNQPIREVKPFQGRTLLQKIQRTEQPERTWQMDGKTGQILVKDSSDLNKITLYSQRNPSSMMDTQTRKALDSPQDNLIMGSQQRSQRHGSFNRQAINTQVGNSLLKFGSLRQNNAREGSTLIKASRDLDGETGFLMNSVDPCMVTQLESPSAIHKNFTRKQPVITISGQQPSEEYLRYMGSLTGAKDGRGQLTCKLRANLQRYGQGHKRVQSANLHSQVNQQRDSRNLYPIVRTQANTINECSSKYLRQSYGTHAGFRSKACTSNRTGGMIEPQNLTIDFNTLPEHARSTSNKNLTLRQKMTKGGRPASSVNRQKAATVKMIRQNSPQSDHLDTVTTVQSLRIDNYQQQKLAEVLMQEEEQIASMEQEKELFQQLINAVQQDPKKLLKRSKTGASCADVSQVNELLTQAKYDSRQNILLTKNPFIIRKDTFGNNEHFNVETLKQIFEVLTKHNASDLSALAQQIPYQLMFPGAAGQDAMKEVELSGTNVGDITLQKDQTKSALFSFLGRLQNYQAANSAQQLTTTTTQNNQNKKRPPLNQGQITSRLLIGNKRRRTWSSTQPSMHGVSNAVGAKGPSKDGSNRVHQERCVNIKTEEYSNKPSLRQQGQIRRPEAAIVDANVYESIAGQMRQVYQSGESHNSTYHGSAVAMQNELSQPIEVQVNQSDLGLHNQIHMTQLRESVEVSGQNQPPSLTIKLKQAELDPMCKSYEPMSNNSQVQVQSIQIAVEGAIKNKTSYNVRNSNHSSASNLRKYGDLVGRETLRQQPTEDIKEQQNQEEPIQVKRQPNSSHQKIAKAMSSSADRFKQNKTHCQSTLPVNKKLSRSGKHIRNAINLSQSLALEVTGRPFSHELSKRSGDRTNSSKRQFSPIKEQSSAMNEEPYEETSNAMMPLVNHLTPMSHVEDITPSAQDYLSHRALQLTDAKQLRNQTQIKSMLPLARMQNPPPLSKTEDNSSDFATVMKNTYQTREQKLPSQPSGTVNQNDRRRVSATETTSRKQFQAIAEPINTDLAMCNEYQDQIISAADTKVIQGGGIIGGGEIKIHMQGQKLLQDFGAQLSRATPQDTNANFRLSFPGSSVDVVRRPYSRDKTAHEPSGIANTTQKDGINETGLLASKQDHFRGKRKTELYPPRSRNNEGPDAVDSHLLSHNSTVKMDIVSSTADGRSELPQTEAKSQIISPQSQIGQVYHKTNLTILQHSKPTNKKPFADKKRNKAGGVSLTNFNNHIIFNPHITKNTNTSRTTRNTRVQSAHFFRRNQRTTTNRAKHQQQHQQLVQQQQMQPLQTCQPCGQAGQRLSPKICKDCDGLRQSWLRDSAKWKTNNLKIDPEAPTQFVISAIESNASGHVMSKGGGAVEHEQLTASPTSIEQHQNMFSPSEHQWVIEQLQELPIELTQQLVLSGQTSTQVASLQAEVPPEDQQNQAMIQQQQQEPVKIVGHKGMKKHHKGLSLIQYSESFLEGQRQKIDGYQTRPNMLTGKVQKKSNRVALKAPKRQPMTMRNKSIKRGQFQNTFVQPSLEVVNSQAMILEQRRLIKTNLDSLVENQQQQRHPHDITNMNNTRLTVGTIISSQRRQKGSITPGSQSLRLGITTMLGNKNEHGARRPSYVDAATYTGTHHTIKKQSDLAHLNDSSNQMMFDQDSIKTKDMDTNHGGLRFISSNVDITNMAQPSNRDVMPNCLSNRGGAINSETRINHHLMHSGGSPPESKEATLSNEMVPQQDQTETIDLVAGMTENSNSRLNRYSTNNRRNIISRQSSTTCNQKLSPKNLQRTLILRHSSEDQYQAATYNVLNNSSAENIPVLNSANEFNSQPTIAVNQNFQIIMPSLSSQRINAFDADSGKGIIVSIDQQQNAISNTITEDSMSKPASDSQPGSTTFYSAH